jgi:hypothetical protein
VIRLVAVTLLLAILAAGCDRKFSSRQAATTRATSTTTCFNEVVGNAPADDPDWAAESRECVRSVIEERLKGRTVTVSCGAIDQGRASCRADWTDSTPSYCSGQFNVRAHGTALLRFVDLSEGPIICSTV